MSKTEHSNRQHAAHLNQPRDFTSSARGLKISGLTWGNPEHPPMLALHGWLDNAESFYRLAPMIEGRYVIAIDLIGHGKSDHRSFSSTYYFAEYVVDIVHLIRSLGYESLDLLGHSLGSGIACCVAAAIPSQVSKLTLIDGIGPWPGDDDEAGTRLQKAIIHSLDRDSKHRAYETRAMLEARRKVATPTLSDESIARIVARNSEKVQDGWQWRTDRRLQHWSPIMFNEAAAMAILKLISCPVLHVGADEGLFVNLPFPASRMAAIKDIVNITLPGSHHLHMDDGVGRIAKELNRFLLTGNPT